MNDADLQKLAIKPGQLEPKFDRNVTTYNVILESTVKGVTVTPVTRDSDASWVILGLGTTRQIPLTNGETKNVVIEVTAEDGTTKQYTINISVLSASCASLSDIKVSNGSLSPTFQPDVEAYDVNLPWYLHSVKVMPEAIDKSIRGANECFDVSLNYGETSKSIEIVSPDGKCTKNYTVKFIKDRIMRIVTPTKNDDSIYCCICTGVIHCPVSVRHESCTNLCKMITCKPCLEMVTRTRKIDPFNEVTLNGDFISEETEFDAELSRKIVFCCYKSFGCDMKVELSQLGHHLKGCACKPVLAAKYDAVVPQSRVVEKTSIIVCNMCSKSVPKDETFIHLQTYCPSNHANTKFEHVVKLRDWEKDLQRKANTSDSQDDVEVNERDNASQLEMAAARYAAMIRLKPRDSLNHFKLATVLEEMYYAKDIWGIKYKDSEQEDDDKALDNLMDMACDSSKEEEIAAICESKGVNNDAPLSFVLKALDQEYHELLNENNSVQADYVQKLYTWKSKQVTKSDKKTELPLNESDDEYLERALLKLSDASAFEPNNSTFHMHIGRLMLMQGKFGDAVKRLEAAFGLKPTCIEAKFYLGLAYAKFYPKQSRQNLETLKLLQHGVDFIMYRLCEEPQPNLPVCSTKVFVRHSNVLMMEGMLELAHLLTEKGTTSEKDIDFIAGIYRQTSSICFNFSSKMKQRNKIYKQMQWISMRAQYYLGITKSRNAITMKDKEDAGRYWDRLSALFRAFEFPNDQSFLQMQNKICEEAVLLCPTSSRTLYRLGDAQLALFDNFVRSDDKDKMGKDVIIDRNTYLEEAEKSYRASIQFEGKAVNGSEHSWFIKDSIWWNKKHKNAAKEKQMETMPESKTTSNQKKSIQATGNQGLTKSTNPIQGKISSPAKSGAVETKKDIVETKKGVVETKKGVVETKKGVAETKKGVAETKKGVLETKKGVVETKKGVVETKKGIVETKKGVLETKKGKPTTSTSKVQVNKKPMSSAVTKLSVQKLAKPSASSHSGRCLPVKPALEGKTTKSISTSGKDDESKTPENDSCESEEQNAVLNIVSYQARLGLARALSRSPSDYHWAEIKDCYQQVMKIAPELHDAYIELGEMVSKTEPKQAIEIYSKYPFKKEGTFDDAYLYGEIIRLLVKMEDFDNTNLKMSMVGYGKIMGFSSLEKTVSILEDKFKFDVLKTVYAEVNDKDVNDQDLQAFFKFKCWT